MRGISDALFQTLRNSHTVVTKADLMVDGLVIYPDLPVTGGEITLDSTAQFLRSVNMTLIDAHGDLVPDSPFRSLTPYGTELKVYRGAILPDGSTEMVAAGVYRLSKTSIADKAGAVISLSMSDRSRTISRSKFTTTYNVAAGTNVADAAVAIIQDRLPGVDMNITATEHVTPALRYDAQADPWADAVQTLATSIGFETYFDIDGVWTFGPAADPSKSLPVLYLIEGPDNVVTEVDTDYDDDPGYNGVIVSGESTGNAAPVRGEAWDDNPASPTYYLGRYGQVPRFETSNVVTTTAQANAMAAGLLQRELGVTVKRQITMIPNPALEDGDVLHLKRAASKADENVVIESYRLPLTVSGLMQVTTRAQSAAS